MTHAKKRREKSRKVPSMVKVGSVLLPYNPTGGPFVPTSTPYAENGKTLETLAYALRENIPTLLIGETGVGKTSAIRYLAAKTNSNLRRVNVNGSMTAEDFVGQMLVRSTPTGSETYWKDGVLTECMRQGYWIVIDEINAASAEILFALHSLLDDDRYIVLTDHHEREIVRAHDNFRIVATMNPPERYAGTKELNKALMSRFGITLNVPIPPPTVEFGILSRADDLMGPDESKKLKAFIADMRSAYEREETDIFVSPRDTAHITRLYLYTGDLGKAIELAVANRGTDAERNAVQTLVKLHTKAEKEVEAKKEEVEDPEIDSVTMKGAIKVMRTYSIASKA